MTFTSAFFSFRTRARLLRLGLVAVVITQSAFGSINSLADLQRLIQADPPPGLSAPLAAPAPAVPTASDSAFFAAAGPWGTLQCAYIYLEATKALVDAVPLPDRRPCWVFDRAEEGRLPELFKRAGLPDAFVAVLLNRANIVEKEGRIHLFPPLADLEAMRPEARTVIYAALARHSENTYHQAPVLMVGRSVAEWYRTSKLRPELIAKISQLSYDRGGILAFSDVAVLLNYAKGEAEVRQIAKSLTRSRSLMVSLVVGPSTKVAEVAKYWSGAGHRGNDTEQLLQSVTEIEGGDVLPISHLMPPMARKLLYTYPETDWAKYGDMPDCHWTALNFFKSRPDAYLLDARLAASTIIENYQRVPAPYQYGDILFFVSDITGSAFHSCVHLADDIVYTKNGGSAFAPWLLMKLEDVKKLYLHQGGGHIEGYRRKPAVPAAG